MTKGKTKRKRGRPSKAELEARKKAEQKDLALIICMYVGLFLLIGLFVNIALSDEMRHSFKSPSFSGVNTSQHYLTIENQEFSRNEKIVEEKKALTEQLAREQNNTTLARFIRNLESRVYAQLSRQLVDNLFGENASESGTLTLEGNLIEYNSDQTTISLKITDENDEVTTISFPIDSFAF
jgi:hypothetical protein|tara:strand:+ start:175 stop:717 length:543 start_codon:yes stop_codon:yes gene_type:complete